MFNLGPQVGVCLYDVSSGRKQVSITHQYAKMPHTIYWGVLAGMGMIYQHKGLSKAVYGKIRHIPAFAEESLIRDIAFVVDLSALGKGKEIVC